MGFPYHCDVTSHGQRPQRLTGLTTYLLSQTAKIAKRELDERLAARGMRLRHMAVLAVLDEAPTTQLDLGRRLGMDPSDITGTVDDLEGKALVARTLDRDDRRRKVVTLTRAGRREIADLDKMARKLADSLLEPVPERRRQRLHADLLRVLQAHDERAAK